MAKFITARYLAEILGITERRVNQISNEKKIFTRDLNGKYQVVECVAAYYKEKYLPASRNIDYEEEKARHERAKREKQELLLAKMKGELHEAATVENVLTNMLVTFRTRMLGVPTKIAPTLIGQKNISKITDIIDREIREVLTELSEYDPAMFADGEVYLDDENDQTLSEGDQGSRGPAANPNGQPVGG